ncbi:MAG TPA: hypothetical protein DCW29_10615 [Janthinobacterium sp.]|nr:hypothetical protein [Janthinobacterium sp.]
MIHVSRLSCLAALRQLSFQFIDGYTLFDPIDLLIDRTPTGRVERHGAVLYLGQHKAPVAGETVGQLAVLADVLAWISNWRCSIQRSRKSSN